MQYYYNMLNEKLKEIRKLNKFKQKDIAKFLKIEQSAYSHYETGLRTPDVEIIKKLCVLYGITTDELLELDTEKKRAEFISSLGDNFKQLSQLCCKKN